MGVRDSVYNCTKAATFSHRSHENCFYCHFLPPTINSCRILLDEGYPGVLNCIRRVIVIQSPIERYLLSELRLKKLIMLFLIFLFIDFRYV
jgi:hypothetical protein